MTGGLTLGSLWSGSPKKSTRLSASSSRSTMSVKIGCSMETLETNTLNGVLLACRCVGCVGRCVVWKEVLVLVGSRGSSAV